MIRQLLPARIWIAAVSLLAVGLTFHSLIAGFQWVLWKQPIPLRAPLTNLAADLGPWRLVHVEPRLSTEVQDVLGSEQYITCYYAKSSPQGAIQGMRMHVVYYTGMPDQIPHVPETCYVGGGVRPEPNAMRLIALPLLQPPIARTAEGQLFATLTNGRQIELPADQIPMRLFTFQTAGRDAQPASVAYFFIANHQFLARRGQVRTVAFDIHRRYAYYAKVEIMPGYWRQVSDHRPVFFQPTPRPQQAIDQLTHFLSDAIGPIMACMPAAETLATGVTRKTMIQENPHGQTTQP